MTCAELLPDPEPFQNFFEAVARGAVSSFPRLSKKMFQVLAMRQKIAEMSAHVRDENPVEVLVRRTLCFFRESKEPLRVILFDDSDFLKFMNESIDELQKRVEQAVLDEAIDRYQRQSYDKRLERNSRFIEQLQREADASANKIFEALSRQAKRRVDNP